MAGHGRLQFLPLPFPPANRHPLTADHPLLAMRPILLLLALGGCESWLRLPMREAAAKQCARAHGVYKQVEGEWRCVR